MKKRNWLASIVIGLLMVSLLLGACAKPAPTPAPAPPTPTPAPSPPPAEPIELKFNTAAPPAHEAIAGMLNFMAAEIEKRTEGRVKMTIYWSSALAPPPGIYDAVVSGVADMSDALASWSAGRFPASEIADIPIGYPSAWVMSYALYDWYQEFQPEEWDETVMLFMVSPPPASIGTTDKPVRTLDDLKGLTIRTPGPRIATMMEALGAVPRPMPITEVYESLSKGVVEGVAVCLETYKGFKLQEVIKYATDMSDITWSSFIYHVMNKDTWNKIQPADQKIIAEICTEAMELRAIGSDEKLVTGIEEFLSLPGREIITLPPADMDKLKEVSQTMIDVYISDMNAIGLPGADYVQYLRERIEYWSKQQP